MRLPLIAVLALCACPHPTEPDSGQPDSGGDVDAGHDAGRPQHDAGVDAGWVSVAIADWCHDLSTAICWRDIRCGRIDETLLTACIARVSLGCDSAGYQRSVTEGRSGYDPIR